MTEKIIPEYIFEASWEVCNMVGGIYTVLSTRACVLQEQHPDKLVFIGPDVWEGRDCQYFTESPQEHAEWKAYTQATYGLTIRTGRWNVPGNPVAVLVDFRPLFARKNEIYGHVWGTLRHQLHRRLRRL